MASAPELEPLYRGWADYEQLLIAAIEPLAGEQLALKAAPDQWTIWQLAAHMAGARMYWLHDVLGEGDRELRELFRVDHTTVPDLPIEYAGWEDNEDQPRSAGELVNAFARTRTLIDACLARWSPNDLQVEFSRQRRDGTETFTRAWVIWHLIEHDLHHGGEVSLILGMHGLRALDL